MSYSKQVTLWCDGGTDNQPCPNSYGSEVVYTTATAAREDAAEVGWTYDSGNDYCPECSEIRGEGA